VGSSPDTGEDQPHLVPILGVRRLVPVSGSRDRRIAEIASLQRGFASRSQLLIAGIESGSISRRLENGRLHAVHRGVYSVGHATPLPWGRETAALLAADGRGVLSHLSAAAAWNMCPARPETEPVDVLMAARHTPNRPGIMAHRTRRLTAHEVRICQGLPVTSPARTLRDIAATVSMRDLERAVDEALVRRIVRLQQLREAAAQDTGRSGGPLLAALIEHRGNSTITRSQAEERMHELIRAAGFPQPESNVRLNGYEVDFLWRRQRVVVEVDGYAYHSSRSAFERDRAKDAALAAAGFLVIRITWLQMEREPYVVVAHLAQALARRS
jgi:very-short-patch-repair endonuclease